MREFFIFTVFIVNAFVMLIWFDAENFGIALMASMIASVVLFPITAIEVLIVEYLFGLFTKDQEFA